MNAPPIPNPSAYTCASCGQGWSGPNPDCPNCGTGWMPVNPRGATSGAVRKFVSVLWWGFGALVSAFGCFLMAYIHFWAFSAGCLWTAYYSLKLLADRVRS